MISTITADSLEDFKNASDVVVIGYFAPDDKTSHKAFTSLADSMRDDHLFGVVVDGTLAKAEKSIFLALQYTRPSARARTSSS
jgi:protein disulfide-isomerase A1